jgi:hypothetical protein
MRRRLVHKRSDPTPERILAYLKRKGGDIEIGQLAPIYHVRHDMYRKSGCTYWRLDRLSRMLAQMEDNGLVACHYDKHGIVTSVRISEDEVKTA